MASLITQVDRTQGNLEQVFLYTVNASFNGVQGDIQSAQIEMFFPDYLNLYLGDIGSPIKNVVENEVEGGTQVIFEFGAIEDLGIAVRIGLGVTFKTDAPNLQIFNLNTILKVNSQEILNDNSQTIQLVLVPRFELRREIVLPKIDPSAGSEIYYKVTLENFGDLGALVENVSIVCQGSNDILLDTLYQVVGNDTSNKFADKSQDGITGVVQNNILTFNISSYKGQKYEFIYKAKISNEVQEGTQLTTVSSFSIDDVAQDVVIDEVEISSPIYGADISIYAPLYTLQNEYICFTMYIENNSNQILQGAVFENELPQEISYYKFNTGAFNIGAIGQNISAPYFIEYVTQNGITGTLGPFNTDNNSQVDLTQIIPSGDNLKTLYWKLTILSIGIRSRIRPTLFGIVNSETPLNSSINNHIHLTYEENLQISEEVENSSTLVADFCSLFPILKSSVNENPVKPNDVIRYTTEINCINSRISNPIIALLLSEKLEFVGNISYAYTDIFTQTTPPQPQPIVVENFNEQGQTLLKFEFKEENAYSFRQLSNIKISFDVKVKIGAIDEFDMFMLLNTLDSAGVIPQNIDIYTDEFNIANDEQVNSLYAKSNTIENRILFFVSVSSDKKVKGALDNTFIEEPQVGKTYAGGNLQYLISVKNIGNATLENIQIVDILPYIGDTGVIQINSQRNSEFPVYTLSEVVADILPTREEIEVDIFYSQSTDPIRFGSKFDVIGAVDDWKKELPDDLSTLRAFKVEMKDRKLLPNETIEISVIASVPVGVQPQKIAWNTFATDVSYKDLNGVTQNLLAVEPEKVGIEVDTPSNDTVSISGYSWLEEKTNGLYDEEDVLINDVGVVLYDENDNQISFTFTNTDINGLNGQYIFNNLPKGRYYIKFFIDDNYFKITKQIVLKDNGNKANKSGVTPIIDLSNASKAINVNIGVYNKGGRTIDEILMVNESTRGVVRDVLRNQMLIGMKMEDVVELAQMVADEPPVQEVAVVEEVQDAEV